MTTFIANDFAKAFCWIPCQTVWYRAFHFRNTATTFVTFEEWRNLVTLDMFDFVGQWSRKIHLQLLRFGDVFGIRPPKTKECPINSCCKKWLPLFLSPGPLFRKKDIVRWIEGVSGIVAYQQCSSCLLRYQALVTSCSNAADSNSALKILDEMQKTRTFVWRNVAHKVGNEGMMP